MTVAAEALIKNARVEAGLTQAQLADRLGTTQSAVARLERSGANPRVQTISRALAACGRRLSLESAPDVASIDETLVARQLRLTAGERLRAFDRAYAEARLLALAGRRARRELA